MVASNPLFEKWTVKRFQATVLNDIWPDVLFFTLIAIAVSLVSKLTSHQLVLPDKLLTVLGTVLGLVISFRTSSAYERYQDGRKMWSNILIASRNLAQLIWIHVPSEPDVGPQQDPLALRGVIEKKTMINLIQAFSVSLKHFLRGEPGVYYEDLYPLVSFLPKYANMHGDMLPLWHVSNNLSWNKHTFGLPDNVSATDSLGYRQEPSPTSHLHGDTSCDDKSEMSWFRSLSKNLGMGRPSRRDPEKALGGIHCEFSLRPARNPPKVSISDYIPLLRCFKWLFRVIMRREHPKGEDAAWRKRKKLDTVESNVPLEILLVLSGYTSYLIKRPFMKDPIAANMFASVNMLQENLSELERIRNTPLPFAYQAHLRMSLWLYLLFFPSQIYDAFGYLTIPATFLTAFLLFGFLEIGQEIENPFNYDLNDLDLDHFCHIIHRELHEITANTNPDPSVFIFTELNRPFAPSDIRSAEDLVSNDDKYSLPEHHDGPEPGVASIRRTLVQSWRHVHEMIRPS